MPSCNRHRVVAPFVLSGAALAFAASLTVRAAPVPYVGSVPLTSEVTGPRADLGGTVLAERSVPFLLLDARFDAEYDLTLQNFVVRRSDTGRLDFYYRVTNDSTRPLRLVDMDTGRFTRPGSVDPIDVNVWDDAAGTYAPMLADRTGSHFGGVALQFSTAEELAPGESSKLFFIRTAATRFEVGGLTQFRSSPGATTDDGFALTFNPVLDGPVVAPPPLAPVEVPLPPAAVVAGGTILVCVAASESLMRRRRRII